MNENDEIALFLEMRKIFHSPLTNHFSPVMQGSLCGAMAAHPEGLP
jgi:hypothetical protein